MTDTTTNYSDGDVDTNRSANISLNEIVAERYSRRQTLLGGLGATTMALFGTSMLTACGDDDKNAAPVVSAGANAATTSGRMVTLTGTATDDGTVSAFWVQTAGPSVALNDSGKNVVTFLAPSVSAATELKFQLTGSDDKGKSAVAETTVTVSPAVLGFTAIAKNKNDVVTVPDGYKVTIMTRLGDPIAASAAAYKNDGSDTDFANRIGDHGDALYWYGLSATGARDDNSSTRGLMVQNHENINQQYLHSGLPSAAPRAEAEVLKEIEAHGVSVTEYADSGNRTWSYVQNGAFNRRITPMTPVVFNGPVKGSDFLKTPFSNDGTQARGTINNCANGHTLWGTNITCEENWAGYFRRSGDDAARTPRELTSLRRYGVTSSTGNYSWSSVATTNSAILRWDARATGASATADFRNEPNQFGWCVEFDPYDKTKAPRKRTALGRLGHEGAWYGKFIPGKKLAVYLGDDAINEYFYKFVTNASWDAADAQATDRLAVGDKYLDSGTLYVAKFNADGTGTWLPLVWSSTFPNRPADPLGPSYVFADQVDILVNTRLAADAVGATPMDRPEWTATNNVTGEIFLTLTNNGNRRTPADTPDIEPAFDNPTNTTTRGTDAANPRVYVDAPSTSRGNRNGHIMRLRENADDPAATGFAWDIYLFGADSADSDANVNISGLNANNDFSSPDGLWFARPQNASGLVKPVLWIQTDDSAFTDRTNNQMLAAMPGSVGDGGVKTITNVGPTGSPAQTQTTRAGAAATDSTLKRFLIGPLECEITGVDTTPDGRTLFVGIQHPGELGTAAAPTSHWPDSQASGTAGATVRPRSAIVAITKNDGGVVAL